MWILKNSKELFDHLKNQNFDHATSIKSFDFSTLYTAILHKKLKTDILRVLSETASFSKIVTVDTNIWYQGTKKHIFLDFKHNYSEDDIIKMLEFLVDNIYVDFVGKVFQQTVIIPMSSNLRPSPSRHLSILIRSEIQLVSVLGGKETVCISVQFHVREHR